MKLMAAIGSWVHLQGTFFIILVATLMGILWSSLRLHRKGELSTRLKLFSRGLLLSLTGTKGAMYLPKLENKTADIIPFGVCLVAASLMWEALNLCLNYPLF